MLRLTFLHHTHYSPYSTGRDWFRTSILIVLGVAYLQVSPGPSCSYNLLYMPVWRTTPVRRISERFGWVQGERRKRRRDVWFVSKYFCSSMKSPDILLEIQLSMSFDNDLFLLLIIISQGEEEEM
jgi:hypothetical protein